MRPVGWTPNGSLPLPGISLIAGLVVPLLLSSAGVGLAQTVDTTFWVTNHTVNTVVHDGSTIYLGGSFTQVGLPTGGAGAIDASTGAVQQPYPKVGGTVYAVTPDGSGGWYLGGSFTLVRGQPRNNLAHLDAGGNLTAWNPSANDVVRALVVSGGAVYAGGDFTSIGGQPRNHIAALDPATGAPKAWNPNANGGVLTLAVSGARVYAGGSFTGIGSRPRNYVAELNAATGIATAWDANPNGIVRALAGGVGGDFVYVGGDFTSIGGQDRNYIAQLGALGFANATWNAHASGGVLALAVSGNVVFVGGEFGTIGHQVRNNIAALDTIFGDASFWNPNSNGVVRALSVSGGAVYTGGDFTNIGGHPRNYIAKIDVFTATATAWNPNPFGFAGYPASTYALGLSGGTVYAGGSFTGIGGQPRNYIAALDAATGAATPWNPNANNPVYALVVTPGTIYAGGGFSSIGGQARNYIATLDPASGIATDWDPNADGTVNALAVSGGTVYAGGAFTSIGGQARSRIAALDATTGSVTNWDPNATGGGYYGDYFINAVFALAVSGGTVYAGGWFTGIGGATRNRIAALDATTGAATAWNPNANGTPFPLYDPYIHILAVSGGTVYAGGRFTSIGGQPRNNVAALDAATGAATAWDPNANGDVNVLAVSGGTVYAGGVFNSIGGQPRNFVAALDVATGVATAWDPSANSVVNALAVSGGKVYAGGQFTSIGGQPQPFLAAISEGHLVSVGGDPTITEGSLTVVPNPTRAGMQIRYSVVRSGRVRLEVLDVSGRVEATLADRIQEPGRHVATWDGVGHRGRLSPGLHFLRLVSPDGVMVRKLAIIQ